MEIALSLEGEDVQIVEVALDSASSALLCSAEELFRLAPGTAELFFEGDLLGEAGLEEVGLTQGCTVLVKPKPGVVARSVLRNDYGIVQDYVGTLRTVQSVPAASMSPDTPHKVSNLALAILSDTSCDVPVALSSALADAVRHSHPACVESLLAAGVSPKGPALSHAAQQGDVDSLRFLLSAIESLPTPAERTALLDGMAPPFRTTALMEAASNGHAGVVQMLLTAGADPGVARYSRTAEMLAASNRHLGVLRVFGSSRAPGRDRYGGSCLTHAIQGPTDADAVASGFTPLSCVEFLLSELPTDELRTAMVNARRVDRRTPLILAAQEGLVDVMTLLLQHGADTGASDNVGRTALATACACGFFHAAQFLLCHGADPNTRDEMGNSPLSLLCLHQVQAVAVADELLKYGANPDHVNEEGVTPLMMAARATAVRMGSSLLSGGAAVDAVETLGNTALFFAVANMSLSFVKLLVANGGDPLHLNSQGRTPLVTASQLACAEITEYLTVAASEQAGRGGP